MLIYILQQGEYKIKPNLFVTTDIKEITKRYANIIKQGGYNLDKPYIQIWKNNSERKESLLFSEVIENEKELLKQLRNLGNNF